MKQKIYFCLIFLAVAFRLSAQLWEVPEDKNLRVSPLKFTSETVKKGEAVFMKNCTSCHGMPTKGDFVKLVPSPGDPSTVKFQAQTDGALFYKIATGRSPMPQFKDIVSEDDLWFVISYFRSFNKDYIQPAIDNTKQYVSSVKAKFDITVLTNEKKIQVIATDTLNKPIKGIGIALFIKRYFGNLPLGEERKTNENGVALYDIPKNILGDKAGNVELIAKLNSEAGDYKKSETLAIAIPTSKPSLTQQRAMWNIGFKAPIWLILSYSIVVLTIWGFLFYIVSMLGKLRKAGNDN